MKMFFKIIFGLGYLFILSVSASAKYCSEKLLEDRNKVPDLAFSESSYKDDYSGKGARESNSNEKAWCPSNQITNVKKEFLIIDLGEIYSLSMIMHKGLSRHGFVTATSYIIEYKRELNSQWISYRVSGVEKTIKANKDYLTEKYDSLDPFIIARWIKIYPVADNPVNICLVLQIYGCKYSGNVLEYKMVDGSTKYDLYDYSYDGDKSGNYLSNGLGKLMTSKDSKVSDPFNSTSDYLVGWSQLSSPSNKVTIIFRFDQVRNFTSLNIETSNDFNQNIKTFSKIEIHFSVEGYSYDKNQIINIVVNDDNKNSEMRFISTDLGYRIGKFVKVVLTFRSDWIIIRRVQFNSSPSAHYPDIILQPPQGSTPISRKPVETDFFSIPLAYTLVIVISVLIILLIIGIPCITIFIRRQKNRNKKCKEALQRHFHEEQARFLTLTQQPFKDYIANPGLFTVTNYNPNFSNMNNRMIQESSIYTSLAGSDTESNCASDKQQYGPPNFNVLNTCPIINPVTTNRSLSNDYSATSFMTLGSSGASYMPYYSHNAQTARSQINLRSQYDITNPISAYQDMYPNDMSQNTSIAMYGPMQLSLQGPVGNSKFHSCITPPDILLVSSLNQLTLNSTYCKIILDNLKYLKTIGRGRYGSIHLAEWSMDQDIEFQSGKKFVCSEYNSLRESLTSSIETENGPNLTQEKQVASVKVLSKDAPTKIKREFYQEIKYLISLNHKNFVTILNLEETALGDCVVVSEYSYLQDVYTYLQSFNMSESRTINHNQTDLGPKIISQSKLLFIASQVASAMKHLESLQLVHSDLACRNILVMNEQLLVKITDLAMSQDKFSCDYVPIDTSPTSHLHKSASCLLQNQSYNINSFQHPHDPSSVCLLPIRWMSWQALIKGVFSNKSDVYTFGITLWELLTLCQKQPYQELTNEQVMINSNLQAHGDNRARVLILPKLYSKEIIDFITHCTLSDDTKRPNFHEIDMFLQHKTIGCQSY